MKKTSLLLVLVLMAVLLVGCGAGSPSGVVRDFYGAVNSGDMEKATGYLSSKVVQSVGVEKLQMALQYQKEAMDGMGGMKKLNITDEQVYDKTALVKAEIEFGNGQTQNADVQLVKESGKWKIDITK